MITLNYRAFKQLCTQKKYKNIFDKANIWYNVNIRIYLILSFIKRMCYTFIYCQISLYFMQYLIRIIQDRINIFILRSIYTKYLFLLKLFFAASLVHTLKK